MLEVKLLGQFDVRRDSTAVVIPSRSAQSLFAYLLLTAGTRHRRERLAGLLWPDTTEENARKSLRNELWRLRKAIETKTPRNQVVPCLIVDEISVGFNAQSDYWLDAAIVEEPLPDRISADNLIKTLSLYRGELLPGLYDDWVLLERERVRAVFEQKMAQLLELLAEDKRWQDTLTWGERWIALGQTPEPAYRAVMVAYGALGNVSQLAAVYERCARAMRDDLGVEPSDQTRELYEHLKLGRATPYAGSSMSRTDSKQNAPSSIPLPLTSFVGREKELNEIAQLLSSSRLLTLSGSGGVGKTRLAIQTANDSIKKFKDGVLWVDLVGLSDPGLIPQEIAQSLQVRQVPNVPLLEMLENNLKLKELLLVLDNCEHLIESAAQTAEQLLGACPNLKILATSRERLGLFNETVWRVPSLNVDTSLQLFAVRAQTAQHAFSLTDSNKPLVVQICKRLDGIPLAIELAAARVAILSTGEIAERLDDRFSLLTSGSRTAVPRHQTLRATIDWSHDLLTEPERILFRRLAVFAGGFTLEAAETICNDGELKQNEILEILGHLIDKSLVIVGQGVLPGKSRYRMLETIRQYARERLLSAGASERLSEVHFDYFLKFAEQAEPKIDSAQGSGWVVRLEAEHDNFRSALEWGVRRRPNAVLKMVTALTLFWIVRGHEAEGRRWAIEALEQADKTPMVDSEVDRQHISVRANALQALARLMYSQGDNAHAIVYSEQAAILARQLGDNSLLAAALNQELLGRIFLDDVTGAEAMATESLELARASKDKLAIGLAQAMLGQVLAITQHDLGIAHEYTEEGTALLKNGGNLWLATMTILSLGMTAKFLGNYSEARLRFLDCLPMFQEMGDKHRISIIRSELAHIERYEGNYQKAGLIYRETILEWQTLGHLGAVANQLECFAFIARALDQKDRAARLLGAAQVLREKTSMPMSSVEQVEYDREVADLSVNMDEKVFAAVWTEGRSMSMEQAIVYALEDKPMRFEQSI